MHNSLFVLIHFHRNQFRLILYVLKVISEDLFSQIKSTILYGYSCTFNPHSGMVEETTLQSIKYCLGNIKDKISRIPIG